MVDQEVSIPDQSTSYLANPDRYLLCAIRCIEGQDVEERVANAPFIDYLTQSRYALPETHPQVSRIFKQCTANVLSSLLSRYIKTGPCTIIEIGAGGGVFLDTIAGGTDRIHIPIELSLPGLKSMRDRDKSNSFPLNASGTSLPLPSGCSQMLLSVASFDFITYPDLELIARGGIVYLMMKE
jgi:hypothetical protein